MVEQHGLAVGGIQDARLQAHGAARGDGEGEVRHGLVGGHVLHDAAGGAHDLDGLARVLVGHVHRGLLDGLELRAVLSGLVHHAGAAHLELEALAAHGLHEHGQVQHAAAGHLDAGFVLQLVDAHGDVALLLAHEAFLQLAATDDFALATHQGARGRLEDDGHGGLLHGDGGHLGDGAFRVGDDVADVGILDADDGHDIAGISRGDLGLAQVLEGVHLANLRAALGPVGLHDEHLLLLVQRAGGQAAHADTAFVTGVVHGADLQSHRAVDVHIGGGNLIQNGVEQRHHVHVAVVGIEARVAVHSRGVHHGEVELLVAGAQFHHEVEDLVHGTLGIGVGAVDLVHDHHNAQAALERMGKHEARLRLGTLVGVHDEQGAVGHVEHALNLAAEVSMARRVDDVDLHARVGDGDVLGKDGDAALALLIVGVEDALFHLLVLAENVRGPQKTVYEGGLAVVDVGDDSDVADVLLLHESSFGSFLGAEIIALCGDDGGVRPQTAPGRQTGAAEGVRCARPDEAAGATTPRGAPRTPCVPR